jgi:DNA-binding response OmpR family regulator
MDGIVMPDYAFRVDSTGVERVSDERFDPGTPLRPAPSRRKGNLLFVDTDDFLLEILESGLALTRPKWHVIAAHRPSEALAVLEEHSELDAIVTEMVFGDSPETGNAFIQQVGRRWPEIPIFVMTHLDPEETRGLDTAEYIGKPPELDFLVSRIDHAIRRQRESLVRGIALPTFLQILEIERKTCTLIVSHGGRVGELSLRGGQLIQARIGGIEGPEALFKMLAMREHSLRVVDKCDAARGISANLTSLLMEWSVREDHAKQAKPAPREENE